jgi:hypothetical protein
VACSTRRRSAKSIREGARRKLRPFFHEANRDIGMINALADECSRAMGRDYPNTGKGGS